MIDCDWWVKKLRTSSRKHRALYIFLIMKKIYPLSNNTQGAITAILDLFKTVIQEEFFAWNSLVKLFCYLPIIECQTKNALRKPRALSCKDNSLKENELTNHMIFTVYFFKLDVADRIDHDAVRVYLFKEQGIIEYYKVIILVKAWLKPEGLYYRLILLRP